jgi:large subunit ribosomal protein L10
MNREEKLACISEVRRLLLSSQATFLVDVQGINVVQSQALRTAIRAQQGKMQVVKNTLSKVALEGIDPLKGLKRSLQSQTALVFAQSDPVAVARAVCQYAKKNDKLRIVAGALGDQVIDKEMVLYLGSLPDKQVIRAQLCGLLKAPLSRHVQLFRQLMVRLVFVLQQRVAQGQEEE